MRCWSWGPPSYIIPFDVFCSREYTVSVIRSFADKDTEKLFDDKPVRRFSAIERPARRKLLLLHRAASLGDLSVPPGNRLEPLRGDRAGQHSIRIDRQWRICFRWKDGEASDVAIVDYH